MVALKKRWEVIGVEGCGGGELREGRRETARVDQG